MGQVQFWDGVILFVGGQVAMDPACCCEEIPSEIPCVDCCSWPAVSHWQPSALVSVDGACEAKCLEAAHIYDIFVGFNAYDDYCYWRWGFEAHEDGKDWECNMYVQYVPAWNRWYGSVIGRYNDGGGFRYWLFGGLQWIDPEPHIIEGIW